MKKKKIQEQICLPLLEIKSFDELRCHAKTEEQERGVTAKKELWWLGMDTFIPSLMCGLWVTAAQCVDYRLSIIVITSGSDENERDESDPCQAFSHVDL